LHLSVAFDLTHRCRCPCHKQVFVHHLTIRETFRTIVPKATAQLTLLLPMKYFSQTTTLENIELRSRISLCCSSICSTHFRRETQVGAYKVILYPLLPRCVNVIAYPLFAGSVFRPGRFRPIVDVFAGGNKPEVGRFASPPPRALASSDCAIINNSSGIGYHQYLPNKIQRKQGDRYLSINPIRFPFINHFYLDHNQ